MTRIFTFTVLTFTALESLCAYQHYFKEVIPDGNGGLVIDSFKSSSKLKENSRLRLTLEFFALWVANGKLIFSALLIVITRAPVDIRICTSISMICGCLLYFPCMSPLLHKLEYLGEIKSGIATNYDVGILWVFTPLWTLTLMVDIYTAFKNLKVI